MFDLFKKNEHQTEEAFPAAKVGATGVGGPVKPEESEFLSSFIQNSAVATFVINLDHKVIFWNSACEELTGVKATDILGTSDQWKPFYKQESSCAADYVVSDWLNGGMKYHKGFSKPALVKEGLHIERFYSNLGGKARYLTFDAVPVYDKEGNLIAAVETLHDITALKKFQDEMLRVSVAKAEHLAVERESKYINSIINVMPIALIVVNPDATIRSVNPRTNEFLGYADQELIGQPMEKVIGRQVLDESVFVGKGLRMLIEKGIIKNLQMNYLTKEGKEIPVAVSVSVERDETAKLEYIVVIAKDMREFKWYAQERLDQLTPILQKAAVGDFSRSIEIPEREDEFTEHLVALNMMLRDLRETVGKNVKLVKELKTEKGNLEKKVEERTVNLDEANKKLLAFNKQLEASNQQLEKARNEMLEKVDEMEIFNKMTMGRELKILELKDEVARLREWVDELKNKKQMA
jgi:PAS domain S-box-containing protein